MSESVYIVLFRGINVGGRAARMETLRAALTGAGFGKVTTYIQSGNVILTSDEKPAEVEALVDRTFAEAFGYSSRPTLRSVADWRRLIDDNPFAEAGEGRQLHAVLLDGRPAGEAIDGLRKLASTERMELGDGVLYLYTPDGFGKSPVAAMLDRLLKVPWTARNWNTVLKLQEMAASATEG